MLLANQSPNLIFASPDGVSGQPDFRPLIANDLPITNLSTTLGANVSFANGTQELYVTTPLHIPANTLSIGDTFKITVALANVATGNYLYNTRIGANGNISDSVVLAAESFYTVGGYTYNFDRHEFLFNVKATGANGFIYGISDTMNGDQGSNPPSLISGGSIIDTTVDNYIGLSLSVISPAQTVNCTIAVVEKIQH